MAKQVSILTGGTNNHTETAAAVNAVATDFIAQGIVGALSNTAGAAPLTGGFALNAQGTPNATTQLGAGTAYVTATPTGSVSQTFRVTDDTGATITHSSNVTGGLRYDWVYISLDPAALANPSTDGSSPVSYITSRSTSNTSDTGTPPTYGYCVAVVALANGFATVTNSNITDKRVRTGVNVVAASGVTNATLPANQLSNPYKFSVYRNAAFTDGNNTYAKLILDTKEFDTGSNFDTTTGKFTAPVTGFYWLTFTVESSVAAGSIGQVALYKNGSQLKQGTGADQGSASVSMRRTVTALVSLAAGDYIETYIYGTAGAGVPGANTTYFSGFLVSAT